MGPKARSHLGLAGNHCQQQTPLSNILEADPEHSTREISFIHQMPENQDQSFLLPSPNTATQSRKKVESKSGEVTIASQLPIAIPASTTPSVSPSTSPWLRASAPLEENSETETETRTMSSHQSQYPHDSSSKKHSSKSKSKPKAKNDDWTGVTEPEERRRIQNRIAQRKFRTRTNSSYRVLAQIGFPSLTFYIQARSKRNIKSVLNGMTAIRKTQVAVIGSQPRKNLAQVTKNCLACPGVGSIVRIFPLSVARAGGKSEANP